jgi:hypothetical protein
MLMTAEIFGEEIGLRTLIVNLDGEVLRIEESQGYQLHKSKALKEDQIPLLEVTIKGKGTIFMDLFATKHKLNRNS